MRNSPEEPSFTKIHHDAAIVFGPRPFVLVILVRGLADQRQLGASG
ncbi:MAG TPA: hypothetical protein VGI46_15585 [Candidatus Acidoferrum sp.]